MRVLIIGGGKTALVVAAALALAGCDSHVAAPTEIVHDKVNVPVPVSCPTPDKYTELMASRPAPLSQQSMPATAQERADKTFAQLGKYEAPGGWADKASAALASCQLPAP